MSLSVCVFNVSPSEIIAAAAAAYPNIPAEGWGELDNDDFLVERTEPYHEWWDQAEYGAAEDRLDKLRKVKDLVLEGAAWLTENWQLEAYAFLEKELEDAQLDVNRLKDRTMPNDLIRLLREQLCLRENNDQPDASFGMVPCGALEIYPSEEAVVRVCHPDGRDGISGAAYLDTKKFLAELPFNATVSVYREGIDATKGMISFNTSPMRALEDLRTRAGRDRAHMALPKYDSSGKRIPA